MLESESRLHAQSAQEFTYLDHIATHAKESAIRRGENTPSWGDVWIAMARSTAVSGAFHARGVSANSFSTEVKYIQIFQPDLGVLEAQYTPAEIHTALLEMKADLRQLEQLQYEARAQARKQNGDERAPDGSANNLLRLLTKLGGSDREDVAQTHEAKVLAENNFEAALRLLANRLDQRSDSILRRDGYDPQHIHELKYRLLEHCAKQPLDVEMISGNPQIDYVLEQAKLSMTAALKQMLQPAPLELSKGGPTADEILKNLQNAPLISPVDLFERVLKDSDPIFEELLFRNGMRTTDADRQDVLAGALPSTQVQDVMLGALGHAYNDNSRELEIRHIAYQLLTDTAVQRHLVKLGIQDLGNFNEKVAECLDPKTERKKGERRASVHPQLPESIYLTIQMLTNVWDETERKEELMFAIMNADKALAEAFTTAGLTDERKADWPNKYEVKEEETPVKRFVREKKPVLTAEQFEDLVLEFCTDQTDLARKGKLDPMIGNERIVDTVITTMVRRKDRNPIITGESGIGKSKIREGLAQAIVAGQVPAELVGARVISLELDKCIKGGSVHALTSILEYAAENNTENDKPKIILDLDKLPYLLEIGGAGFIQPHLTKAGLLLLSTASDEQVTKQLEKNKSVETLLKPVPMGEPDEAATIRIMAGIIPKYAEYHGVEVGDDMAAFIAEQAGRYIHTIGQPSKSIDLLDAGMAEAKKARSKTLEKKHIYGVISGRTGIPLSYLTEDEGERYLNLEARLNERVYDQPNAVSQVIAPIIRAKTGFKDPLTPIANFLFVGPTGVGKTELAVALATYLMGSPDFLVRFDMSEYMEKHSISRFIGSPPGYVNNDEGGRLITEARRKPNAVFLYDEAEKAHPDIFNALLAPFSNGIATDGRGRKGNFRNIINVMTSNIGAVEVEAEGTRRGLDPLNQPQQWHDMSTPIYLDSIKLWLAPEFRNRLDAIICFQPLSTDTMVKLIERCRGTTEAQLRANHGLGLDLSPAFQSLVIRKGFNVSMGARPLQRAWRDVVETPIAHWLLGKTADQKRNGQAIVMSTRGETMAPAISFKL